MLKVICVCPCLPELPIPVPPELGGEGEMTAGGAFCSFRVVEGKDRFGLVTGSILDTVIFE